MQTPIDEYLAGLPEDVRAALEELRQTIRTAIPEATEVISYQVPVFKHEGKPLVGFGATKSGCTFYVMSTEVFDAYAHELRNHKTGKGSVRFQPDQPISSDLVKKIVMARLAENQGR